MKFTFPNGVYSSNNESSSPSVSTSTNLKTYILSPNNNWGFIFPNSTTLQWNNWHVHTLHSYIPSTNIIEYATHMCISQSNLFWEHHEIHTSWHRMKLTLPFQVEFAERQTLSTYIAGQRLMPGTRRGNYLHDQVVWTPEARQVYQHILGHWLMP